MVGIDQLLRLERLLASDEAKHCIKIIVTHYPLALADGKPERRQRRLRDLHDLLTVAQQFRVQLWLHGHRHESYVVPATPDRSIAAVCVGSGTMHDHWSFGEYTFDQKVMTLRQYTYQPALSRFILSQESKMDLWLPPS
jgi:hypothetical protein